LIIGQGENLSEATYSDKKAFNYKLLIRLRQADETVHALRQKELQKIGITSEQARALHVIHYFGTRATAFELAKMLSRKPPAMTVILRRLENKQLIKKTLDKDKKTTTRLSLTRKGHEVYHQAMELPTLEDIFNKLMAGEKEQLCTLLEKVRDIALNNLNVDVESYVDLVNKLDMK
jgi:DNA-binding MarR family transcriptional regulator